jgi:hypothetical protein
LESPRHSRFGKRGLSRLAQVVQFLYRFLPTFLLVYFGSSIATNIINYFPLTSFTMRALTALGGMLPAVGVAILAGNTPHPGRASLHPFKSIFHNFAWCFDCVPEENSLYLKYGSIRIEIPALDVVLYKPRELLGEKVYARFGAEFPIRFDFLDTMDGGNLSLQVHPLTEYIQITPKGTCSFIKQGKLLNSVQIIGSTSIYKMN